MKAELRQQFKNPLAFTRYPGEIAEQDHLEDHDRVDRRRSRVAVVGTHKVARMKLESTTLLILFRMWSWGTRSSKLNT